MAQLPSRGWWRFINPGPFNSSYTLLSDVLRPLIRLFSHSQGAYLYYHHGIYSVHNCGGYRHRCGTQSLLQPQSKSRRCDPPDLGLADHWLWFQRHSPEDGGVPHVS